MSFGPTIILALPGINRAYERGKLAELNQPIARPGTPATKDEIQKAANAINAPVNPVSAIINGATLEVQDFIEDAKQDAVKAGIAVGVLGLALYLILRNKK